MSAKILVSSLVAFMAAPATFAVSPGPTSASEHRQADLTLDEAEQAAEDLLGDYEALSSGVDACPQGACEEASALASRWSELDAERRELNHERAQLDPCDACEELDSTLAAIDELSSSVTSRMGTWNEQT